MFATRVVRAKGLHEEQHISRVLRWLTEQPPFQTTLLVENACLAGLNLLPSIAFNVVRNSQIRLKVLTHVDQLSDAALCHQIAVAQQADPEVALFALALREDMKAKELNQLQYALSGAWLQIHVRVVLVCGVPNAGKSSLILPLTRERTLRVRNKKAYHLPKIDPKAGRTLAVKKHVLPLSVGDVTLMDSPGLRPRMSTLDARAAALFYAAGAVASLKRYEGTLEEGHKPLDLVVRALNRHAEISQTTPEYVKTFGLSGPLTVGRDFYKAVQNYQKAIGDDSMLTENILVPRLHQGKYGGMVFGAGRVYLDFPTLKLNRNSAVVYMNEKAQYLCLLGRNHSHSTGWA